MQGSELLPRVARLIKDYRDARVIIPETADAPAFTAEQEEKISSLLHQTYELLWQVSKHYAEKIDVKTGTAGPTAQIPSLCAMVQSRILQAQDGLASAGQGERSSKLFTLLESSWHEALKGLIALEASLRESEGLPKKERLWFYLEESLETRRLYGRLRAVVLGTGEPAGGGELAARLAAVAEHLTALRRTEIYPLLRLEDRYQLLRQQERLARWLEQEGDAANGRELWQDLSSYVHLLRQVNLREELIEHDRRLVGEILEQLSAQKDLSGRAPEALLEQLEALRGKDPQLDHLLERAEPPDLADLRPLLERMGAEVLAF